MALGDIFTGVGDVLFFVCWFEVAEVAVLGDGQGWEIPRGCQLSGGVAGPGVGTQRCQNL